ncbi:uncharacterized protein K460DRAFT_409389 [Cucurbitaria berberidis CBS 394.84]|uniref:Uncharacterized protein n=1 Tax=Cucurbitaria berberidis CBS 394.84 TaxID=1168544 RepID=A0A9P4GAD7_9PLEO|nr:uncharacterized protein K460DRAFT_409389 [Cucurbitaria berberidis CBS 394.84]KAF1841950.1 hypothetical protein K460DRAFT_409389 [Cucurbitaria berberidis CBS 394.84]
MFLSFFSFFSFLITYEFYSRLGFLISYTAASLLALEVLRLVYTDANKREVEKMLDSYTQSRSEYSQREDTNKVDIEELAKHPQTPPRVCRRRTSSPAVTPESEKTLVNEARRRRAQSSASQHNPATSAHAQAQVPTPTRRLRKRSDTVTSTGSTEHRKLERRRREASPASSAGSKASSRHASPSSRRVRDKEAQQLSSSLHKLMRQKV